MTNPNPAYGTWASAPDALSQQLTLPSGQTFESFFHDLTQSTTVSCNANRAPGSTGCCDAPGINYAPPQDPDQSHGNLNCRPGCLCCIAYQLQNAGAQHKDIVTYVNSVIGAGCNGVLGTGLAGVTDISEICATNSHGCYTGQCIASESACTSCTPFIPGPYSGSSCPGVSPQNFFQRHWLALVIAAVVMLLLLGGVGYYMSRR